METNEHTPISWYRDIGVLKAVKHLTVLELQRQRKDIIKWMKAELMSKDFTSDSKIYKGDMEILKGIGIPRYHKMITTAIDILVKQGKLKKDAYWGYNLADHHIETKFNLKGAIR